MKPKRIFCEDNKRYNKREIIASRRIIIITTSSQFSVIAVRSHVPKRVLNAFFIRSILRLKNSFYGFLALRLLPNTDDSQARRMENRKNRRKSNCSKMCKKIKVSLLASPMLFSIVAHDSMGHGTHKLIAHCHP